MNLFFITVLILFKILSFFFIGYILIFYIALYLLLSIHLKPIFHNNYNLLFSKVALASSIKDFITKSSYFSIFVYLIFNTIFFISTDKLLYRISFIISLSITIALISNYNGSKNKIFSLLNLPILLLIGVFLFKDITFIVILLTALYGLIIYKILYNAINSRLNT